ncbi:GNAT family N-acetyltransferase [Pseudomonas mangiferae]|uniref:GNAT family N-acetyltransferase n=1 Tax=Pseudomonas mangiferae TaxID=2593654 RepID=A0A553H4R5_9PSED|nr:GNAT family N-acetyltransferase [Pseudomonas mangiferae]TRX76737.1 GNAT family N-acetyltransferase [Pseudomonas mangiferae]
MPFQIRAAVPDDVPAIFEVRTSVRENLLTRDDMQAMGITEDAVSAMIQDAPCAWVATEGSETVGFSMIIPDESCLFAAFILPRHENKGLGRQLVQVAEAALFADHAVAWLETGRNTRAAGFYRHLGWGHEQDLGNGDIRLEKWRVG